LAKDRSKTRRRLLQGLVLGFCAVLPACLCQLLVEPAQDRYIHIESFRYGKKPSVIRCNRGDRLHLTFETRDTAHSFFLEEFDIDVKIAPGDDLVSVFRPSDPEARPTIQKEVVFVARHPGWLGGLVSKSHFRCHVWCGPMHAFEQGNLIIEPNTLLFAALGLLLGIPLAGLLGVYLSRSSETCANRVGISRKGKDVFTSLPWLKRLIKRRGFQFSLVTIAMLFFYLIILTALFGTVVSGRNLGVMLTWVVWLFLLVAVLTPLGGRIWCLVCPIPFLGEALQRMALTGVRPGSVGGTNNRFFGGYRPLPKWLRSAWPRTVVFLVMGTFSTVLVASPRATGWAILGMLILATFMALIWEGRSFCRGVCPINAFVGLYSTAAKLRLTSVDPLVCQDCKARTCQKGSQNGWACPYGVCVADLTDDNSECGLCTECIKSCLYDNVTLRIEGFNRRTKIGSISQAFLAMAMLVLGLAYCIVHLGHWPWIRDAVNILDKANWGQFTIFAVLLWATALVVVPVLMLIVVAASKRLIARADADPSFRDLFLASASTTVPLGLMVWVAFVVPMLFVNISFVAQALSDPFGWGWDFFQTAGSHWHQLWPRAIPWIQVGCLLVGFGYSLATGYRAWRQIAGSRGSALRGMIPLVLFLTGLTGWLVWFLAN